MMLDNAFKFSVDQAVTTTANSTNVLNLGAARELFSGYSKNFKLVINCSAHSGTITIQPSLVGGDEAALTSANITIASMAATEFVAGTKVEIAIPPQSAAKQYYGVIYTASGTTSTTLDAYISECEEEFDYA